MTEQHPLPDLSPAPPPAPKLPTMKDMRHAYSFSGWSIFALFLAISVAVPLLVSLIVAFFGLFHINTATFLENNLLYLNEVLVAIALLIGAIFLFFLPKTRPARHRTSPKLFFFLFLLAIFFSTVSSYAGLLWSTLFDGVLGNSFPFFLPEDMGTDINTAMSAVDPLQMFISVGILAPIIEEFFFRKLLIDRLYRHGELGAILFSSIFFAFFHQNFQQFFYTLSVGLLLGYLYCKTGSYLSAVLMHMVFNIFSGVIPALCTEKLFEFMELTSAPEMPEISKLSLVVLAVVTILYIIYLAIRMILMLAGGVLFFVYARKIEIKEGNPHLPLTQRISAAFLNVGMASAVLISFIMLISSTTMA